jgi:S1-C subfamily serine protease
MSALADREIAHAACAVVPLIQCAPYPWHRPDAQELHLALVSAFPAEPAALYLAAKIGIQSFHLALGQPVFYLWRDILDMAAGAKLLQPIVSEARADRRAAAFYPTFDAVLAAKTPVVSTEPRAPDGSAQFMEGSADISEPEALLFADDLTLTTGRLTALIDTLGRLLEVGKSVCLLRVDTVAADGSSFVAEGTGFRIGKELVLTNHHVLRPESLKATAIKAYFGYEQDAGGAEVAAQPLAADLASIVSEKQDDWGIIRVPGIADEWPIIDLNAAGVPTEGEGAFIVQHPRADGSALGSCATPSPK